MRRSRLSSGFFRAAPLVVTKLSIRLWRAYAEQNARTERAYVELRAPDDDGGESIVTAIFSYRTIVTYSKPESTVAFATMNTF